MKYYNFLKLDTAFILKPIHFPFKFFWRTKNTFWRGPQKFSLGGANFFLPGNERSKKIAPDGAEPHKEPHTEPHTDP